MDDLTEVIDAAIQEGHLLTANVRVLTQRVATLQQQNDVLGALLWQAMLRLCDHGESALSSQLVRDIKAALG